MLSLVARQWLWSDKILLKWDTGAVGSAGWIKTFWPLAVAAVVVLPAMLWPLPPRFAVFKDGIKLETMRLAPKRSGWGLWSYEFYSWSEVDYCRCSRYQTGVLAVHLKTVEQYQIVLWGTQSPTKLPPMIFHFRVPERYRAGVEAAIRSCGKWAE